MKKIIVAALLLSSSQVFAKVQASGELDRPGPEAVAISLMSQFYEVKPDAVAVKVHNEPQRQPMSLRLVPGGHSCVFSMVPAPLEPRPRTGGW